MGATDGTPQYIAPPVLGLPRMHMEAGERRDFLPEFVAAADRAGAGEIVLEHGYGAGMGFGQDAYLAASPKVRFADYAEVLASDIVTVIRCPDEAALRSMRPGRGAGHDAALPDPSTPHQAGRRSRSARRLARCRRR